MPLLTLRVPQDLLTALNDACAAAQTTRTAYVKAAIEAALDRPASGHSFRTDVQQALRDRPLVPKR